MKAAVIDVGSGSVKAGFGGNDYPKVMFPSVIGKPRHDGIMPAIMGGKDVYIGEEIYSIKDRGKLRLTHPIEAGSISDWEGFELLLHHTFYDELMVPPHDAPLLLTETPQNDKKKREKLTEILFETLGIPSLLLQSQPILALAGTGLTSDRGKLRLTHPIEAGSISDWEGFELLLHHTFYDELMVPPHDAPLLLTETPQNDKKKREKLTEILFETLGIPSLLLQSQPILALAGTGLTSGVVVDSGAGSTHIVPIYQGVAIDHAMEYYPVNGSDITNFLISLLRERMYDFHSSPSINSMCKMKEELCYVHPHAVKDISYDHLSAEEFAEYNYKLPDGQEIVLSRELPRATEALFFPSLIGKDHPSLGSVIFNSIVKCDVDIRNDLFNNIVLCGGNTLFKGFASRLRTELPDGQEIVLSRELPRATEALFFPSLIGKDHPSLGSVIFNSIVKCDVDIRNDLFNNIVLCGGNTLFKGFASRLRTEVDKSIDKGPKIHVNVIDTPEREYSVWLGGSIMTCLSTFESMLMTSKEYDDQGAGFVHTFL
ncbi:Actin family like protein [Aduncisulcus paluster]|uniref:Actin family like protein n=1 Tax=Aduncisulcus paluster TaxID=2918883 RepID=A0ABQ5JZW2_9EUKA|nr:Actin family like protein [Aduncisulcus paluster]